MNSPGSIDPDFRAEIGVILHNHSKNEARVDFNERIAQMVTKKIHRVKISESDDLVETERGNKGFGSTGQF